MKTLVIIPTLNEKTNIFHLYKKLKKLNIKFDMLFVDDNSDDGSQEVIKKLAKKNKNVKYIFRPKKMGIGSAHKDAFKWAYQRRYSVLVTMDADGTHDPKYIKLLIKKLKNHSMSISNRFIKPNLLRNWPPSRIFLTYLRHITIQIFLSVPYDTSGAFRCIDCRKVPLSHLIAAKDNGYSYFWESIFILHRKKHSIAQAAVPLPYRQVGSTHITSRDIFFAIYYLLIVFIRKILGKY